MDWVKLGAILGPILGLISLIWQWVSKIPRIEGEIIEVKVCQIDKPRIGISYQDKFDVNFRIAIDIKFINHRESSSYIEKIWLSLKSKKINKKLEGNFYPDLKIEGRGKLHGHFLHKDEEIFEDEDIIKEVDNIPNIEYTKFLMNKFPKKRPIVEKWKIICDLINNRKYEINYKITGRKWKTFKITP